jgi:hypothetical protein
MKVRTEKNLKKLWEELKRDYNLDENNYDKYRKKIYYNYRQLNCLFLIQDVPEVLNMVLDEYLFSK